MRSSRCVVAVGALALAVAACGGGHRPADPAKARIAREVAVVRAWADALRKGNVNAAASYFALPSVFANGAGSGGEIEALSLRTSAQARAANATLPCGARFVSATPVGRYLDVLFRLTGRPGPGGTTCGSGAGATARTDFLIRNGKIAAWIRAPDVSPGPTTAPTVPSPTLSTPPVSV